MSHRTTATLLAVAAALSACGGAASPAQVTPARSTAATTATPSVAVPHTSATASPVAGLTDCGAGSARGILGASAATSLQPDGSARSPASTFGSASTATVKIIIGVTGLAAGTKLSFTRYLDGKYVDTGSSVLVKPTTYFYFDFTAQPGKRIATGTYQVRLYVNEARACSLEYQVT